MKCFLQRFMFIILIMTFSVFAEAEIDYYPPIQRFGMRSGSNYQWWVDRYLQGASVYTSEFHRAGLVNMLRGSFKRLKGDRRPIYIKEATRFLTELWIAKSNQIAVPRLQIESLEKSPFVHYSYVTEAALILVPAHWNVEYLSVEQKKKLDQIVLQASPEIVIVTWPGQTYGEMRYEDYVREWQKGLAEQQVEVRSCSALLEH